MFKPGMIVRFECGERMHQAEVVLVDPDQDNTILLTPLSSDIGWLATPSTHYPQSIIDALDGRRGWWVGITELTRHNRNIREEV